MSDFGQLLTEYGNSQFDCGSWRDQDEFIPCDAEPEWLPYAHYLEASTTAKAAVVSHIGTLEQERDALAGEVRRLRQVLTEALSDLEDFELPGAKVMEEQPPGFVRDLLRASLYNVHTLEQKLQSALLQETP